MSTIQVSSTRNVIAALKYARDGKDDEIVEFQSSDFSDKRDLNVVVQLNLFESMFAENST